MEGVGGEALLACSLTSFQSHSVIFGDCVCVCVFERSLIYNIENKINILNYDMGVYWGGSGAQTSLAVKVDIYYRVT